MEDPVAMHTKEIAAVHWVQCSRAARCIAAQCREGRSGNPWVAFDQHFPPQMHKH